MQILVAEDEINLAKAIGELLRGDGYRCETVFDGQDALDYASAVPYDLVILDVVLPRLDGCEVVRKMRDAGLNTPVLMLTARSTVPDKVAGLNAGADDYMTKPFSGDELLARVKAVSRRTGTVVMHTLKYEDLLLDIDSGKLTCGNRFVQLSRRELEVARIFLSKPQVIVPKGTLYMHVWGTNAETTDNNVEAYISFLRKKLRYIGSRVTITTQIGIGYILETPLP